MRRTMLPTVCGPTYVCATIAYNLMSSVAAMS